MGRWPVANNVITLTTAATAPVRNPKTRGRPKGTISLNVERARRQVEARPVESPYHPMVAYPRPGRKGRFHYPKELLLQRYICRDGHGIWRVPRLPPAALVDDGFISPMKALLEQLKAEGHDVSAAKLEWLALRDAASYFKDLGRKLFMGGPPSEIIDQESWDFDDEPPPTAS
jgi:hypothetical protein